MLTLTRWEGVRRCGEVVREGDPDASLQRERVSGGYVVLAGADAREAERPGGRPPVLGGDRRQRSQIREKAAGSRDAPEDRVK